MDKMDVLVDLQFGSTGKGALAGYLSVKNDYDAVVSCNMPNAGHTAYSPDTGEKFMHKVLPSGVFGGNLRTIGIGPGAVFDPERLLEEWAHLTDYYRRTGKRIPTLLIHEACGILTPKHREIEQSTLSRISSTMQGSAEALISKIRREDNAIAKFNADKIHKLLDHGPALIVNQNSWLSAMWDRRLILAEGSQGYSLSISAGFYPYCTSRDCTVGRVIADCSLPARWINKVYGSARVHPIRVGNTPDGYSGGWYRDQIETSFEELGVEPEKTTVTQRVRRIATFSAVQIREAMAMALPHEVFLNFYQYDRIASDQARWLIDMVANDLGCGGVGLIGEGPLPSDIKVV